MQYLVTQWIIWLIVAALIGGAVGFMLNRVPTSTIADTEATDLASDDGEGSGEPADPTPTPTPVPPKPDPVEPPPVRPILGIPRPQHEEVVAERDELRRLLEDRDMLIDTLYDAVDERDARIGDLTSTLQETSAASSGDDDIDIDAVLDEHEAAIDALYDAVDERQAAINALREAIDERDAAIDALYDAVDERDRRIEQLRHLTGSDDPASR